MIRRRLTTLAVMLFVGISATAAQAGTSVPIHPDYHKVVVWVPGINTTLSCSGAVCQGTDIFDDIRGRLKAQGFSDEDFLWFSYKGGKVDPDTGDWLANSYDCAATAQNYSASLDHLYDMVRTYLAAHPRTNLYLVGHSQGGLLALQELGDLKHVPDTTNVAGIITLDGALGGQSSAAVRLAQLGTCWSGPAGNQMTALYNSATDHDKQGTTARLLCTMIGSPCPDFSGSVTNREAVTATGAKTRVTNFGNKNDGVFNPGQCGVRFAPLDTNASSSQVVEGSGELEALGGNTPTPPLVRNWIQLGLHSSKIIACTQNSHAKVASSRAQAAADIIGPQA